MKAVIFDMDGVIVDSEPVYMQHFYEFFKRFDQPITYKEVYTVIGTTMETTWEIFGEFWNPKMSGKEFEDFYTKNDISSPINYADIKLPHLHYLMRELKNRGIKMAIASSSPETAIKAVIKQCRLEPYISYYISGESLVESKPNPEIYHKTMKILNVRSENTIIIEDAHLGIESGVRSGASVIAIKDTRFNQDQSRAHFFASDLMETLNIILDNFKMK